MSIKSKEYFPPTSNSIYIYRCFNNNLLNFKSSVDYFDDNKLQVRFDNGINNVVNIYEYADDGVKLSFQIDNTYPHQNFLDKFNNIDNYLIKEPIVENNIWLLPDGSKRCITNVDMEVKTQLNLFSSAIEIVTIFKNKSDFSVDYYVKGIGLVKSLYYMKKLGFLYCELEDILENTPNFKNIKIYYPDKNLNTIWYSNRNLTYNTNEDITLGLSELFKTPPNGLLPLMNRNTKINKLYYNHQNNFAQIDFNSNIIESLKSNLINSNIFFDCIYNTLKDYYKSEKIYITIDNNPYTDYFSQITPTDKNKIIEWKVQDCKYPFTYLVKENETLINISNKFDINYIKISKLNNIKNPNKISKGQILQLYSSGIYKVKEGDSLESICEMFNLNFDKLTKINNISNLSLIKAGQKIKLC